MILHTTHRISKVVIAYIRGNGRHSQVVNLNSGRTASKLLSPPRTSWEIQTMDKIEPYW